MSEVHEGFINSLHLNFEGRSLGSKDLEIARQEADDAPPYYRRRSAGVWACLASLALILAVVVGYGYTVLEQEGMQLEQVPGMAKSLSAIGQHVGNLENRLADSRVDQRNLAAQIQRVGAESQAALNMSQQQTEAMVAHAQETVFRHLNQQTGSLYPQMAQLMRERAADRLLLAQLEHQLAQARYEIASTRRDYTRQVEAFRELQDELHREIANAVNSSQAAPLNADLQTDHGVGTVAGGSSRLTSVQHRHDSIDVLIDSATSSK